MFKDIILAVTENDVERLTRLLSQLGTSALRQQALTSVTDSGDSLLHIAAQNQSLQMVATLIRLGVSMTSKNAQGMTAVQLAYTLNSVDVAVFLQLRLDWQKSFAGIKAFPLDRCLAMVHEAYTAVQSARGSSPVFVIGSAGVGKSTMINALNGARYRLEGVQGFNQKTALVSGVEVCKVGHSSVVSETLFPEMFTVTINNKSLQYVDLAGINGTRDPMQELAGTLGIHLLGKMVRDVKGVLFVIDLTSLSSGRTGTFRDSIRTLNKILQNDFFGTTSESVCFAFTKVPEGVTTTMILASYIEPLLQQMTDFEASGVITDEDLQMLATLQLMKKSFDKLFIADVCDDGQSLAKMHDVLCDSQTLQADALDFLHVDCNQENFLQTVTFLAGEFNQRLQSINHQIPDQLVNQRQQLQRLENSCDEWREELEQLQVSLSDEITPQAIQEIIQTTSERREQALSNKLQLTNQKSELVSRIQFCNESIGDIDTDNPVNYGSPQLFQHNTEMVYDSAIEVRESRNTWDKIDKIGQSVPLSIPVINIPVSVVTKLLKGLFGGRRKLVIPDLTPRSGMGNYCLTNNSNEAPATILNVVCHSSSGSNIVFQPVNIDGSTYSVDLQYPYAATFTAQAQVQIAERDLPENALRIRAYTRQIEQLNTQLEEVDAQLLTVCDEVDVLDAEITNLQAQGCDSASLQEQLRVAILQRAQWLDDAGQPLLDCNQAIAALMREKQSTQLELSLNADLFRMLYKIVGHLGFDETNDVISGFVKTFDAWWRTPSVNASRSFRNSMPGVNLFQTQRRHSSQPCEDEVVTRALGDDNNNNI